MARNGTEGRLRLGVRSPMLGHMTMAAHRLLVVDDNLAIHRNDGRED